MREPLICHIWFKEEFKRHTYVDDRGTDVNLQIHATLVIMHRVIIDYVPPDTINMHVYGQTRVIGIIISLVQPAEMKNNSSKTSKGVVTWEDELDAQISSLFCPF